jgi:hypothetical protein
MARAEVHMHLGHSGASLAAVGRELRDMDARKVTDIFKRRLDMAAGPFPARIRASALAIPTKPEGKHTGLRARIAQCVTYSSGTDLGAAQPKAYGSLWVDTRKMAPDYRTLPLYMQGVKEGRNRNYSRWRHPVYGNRENWATQPSHPYFYQAAEGYGRAGGDAVREALDDITRKLNG